jgi:hypothetical protein
LIISKKLSKTGQLAKILYYFKVGKIFDFSTAGKPACKDFSTAGRPARKKIIY